MKDQTRREFIETSVKGAAGVAAGLGALDNLLSDNSIAAKAASSAGNNSKQASSVINLPKGGGAIKGIGESFQPNPFTGTANISFPIATSPGRSGFGPELSLQYSSGNGNGPFGMGWALSVPQISRKTEKGIPKYNDNEKVDETEKDTFLLSGAEDLVLRTNIGKDKKKKQLDWPSEKDGFKITYYRPRTEGLFARIEKWEGVNSNGGDDLNSVFWKITTKENITNIYGFTKNACLAHPKNDKKIFQWFLELTFDAKGNYVYYQYKPDKGEDIPDSIYEHHRKSEDQTWQVYLKYIRYGNQEPFRYSGYDSLKTLLIKPPSAEENFFNVVFDYGEHVDIDKEDKNEIIPYNVYEEIKEWERRDDPFSFYRSAFETRTYRKCKKILMFTNIPDYSEPTLVKSTDFKYQQDKYNNQSMLISVTQRGYRRKSDNSWSGSEEIHLGGKGVKSQHYHIKSLPPLEFKYSEFNPEKRRFKSVEFENNEFPSTGLTNPNLTFIDLFGTALPDLLETTPYGFYYQKNLGNGKFSIRNKLKNAPAGITLDMESVGFADINGNGMINLCTKNGFWKSNQKGGWKPDFKTYKRIPSFSLSDANIRLVDLNDGSSDILRTEDHSLTWFPCKEEEGWDEPRYAKRVHDLEEFPDVYFSDQRVRMADMAGDGLNDIVMIHNGRVDYWPNLGYGRFGKRITMKGVPRFGANFDPQRLFLVDIDGSGPCDLVYVDSGEVCFWFNQSGNGFSEKFVIKGTPRVTNNDSIQFADILGNGSNCLVYSKDYSVPGRSNFWYLDFTGGIKYNLLYSMNNNLGSFTNATYKSSTYFYLKDRLSKRVWVSTLPFPVQVLEKVEVIDHISRTKLVTRYAYHHGYYDGREREFRGFASVEQWDTEHFDDFVKDENKSDNKPTNVNKGFHVPPVHTKTWYHTGAHDDEKSYEELKRLFRTNVNQLDFHNLFSSEYYKGDQDKGIQMAYDLPNSILDSRKIDIHSLHEAYRALRGSVLRQEVYADDNSDQSKHPYTVTESNFITRLLQKKGKNKHAVFFVYPNETLSYHYERNPKDPRIGHEINLKVDEYGNVSDKINIGYPRRSENDPLPEQQELNIIYNHSNYIKKDQENTFYCHSIPYEQKTYEIKGIKQPDSFYLGKSDFKNVLDSNEDETERSLPIQDYHWQRPKTFTGISKRLLQWKQVYFKKNRAASDTEIKKDANSNCPVRTYEGRCDLGEIESLMLPCEEYQAAFSEQMVKDIYGIDPVTDRQRINEDILKCAGYILQDNYWWIPSGQQAFKTDFYLPYSSVDPLGNSSTIQYDEHNLLPIYSEDALNNQIIALNDYYTLQPYLVRDPNQNRTQVAFDALGMVAGTAIMGKAIRNEGDTLIDFDACIDYNVFMEHVENPVDNDPYEILKGATSAILYDLWRNKSSEDKTVPVAAYTISREIHFHDLNPGEKLPIQRSILYSDGFGREVQTKMQAEPDEFTPTQPCWIGSGWKVYNNKGKKPVMQFEPFFSDTHEFEYNRQEGISPVLFYDPLERVVCTLHPNHTYEKVVFGPWWQKTWDTNDTVLMKPLKDKDIGGYVKDYFETETDYKTWYDKIIPDRNIIPGNSSRTPEQQAAIQTQKHADTPTILHLDNLSRPFKTIQNNAADGDIETKVVLDVEGNELEIIDPMGIHAFKHQYTMTGEKIVVDSTDAGKKINFSNVVGNPVRSWDANENHIETTYDWLNRPKEVWVKDRTGYKYLAQKTVYGENRNNAESIEYNMLLQVYQVCDGAGIKTNAEYDFKDNLIETKRRLFNDYKLQVDWNSDPAPILEEGDPYTSKNKFDALNRIIESELPDQTKQYISYNKTGLLKKVSLLLLGESDRRRFVNNIDYNAKGQRNKIDYENGVVTEYSYEPDTFRLSTIVSKKNENTIIQNLRYTYDPVGNITHLHDAAFETIFNYRDRIDPSNKYAYDPIYRLIKAQGREHEEMTSCHHQNFYSKHTEIITLSDQPVNNGQAIHNYTETYAYDKNGNITLINHFGNAGSWTRNQTCNTPESNKILTSKAGCNDENEFQFRHGANGNILSMPHLPEMKWDYANRLTSVELNIKTDVINDRVFYNYDAAGQRVRKVIEHGDSRVEERLYIGGYEIYRKYSGENITFKRSTIHVMDDQKRIALIEKKIEDMNHVDDGPDLRIRYQLENHQGSSMLELDENANEISYEQYYPYGGTAYMAGENETEIKLKRYSYSGKERDETGLYYYGARYYAPWIGRWLSCDPAGIADNLNLFTFTNQNPIVNRDLNGFQSEEIEVNQIGTQIDWDRVDKTDGFDFSNAYTLRPTKENFIEALGQLKAEKKLVWYSNEGVEYGIDCGKVARQIIERAAEIAGINMPTGDKNPIVDSEGRFYGIQNQIAYPYKTNQIDVTHAELRFQFQYGDEVIHQDNDDQWTLTIYHGLPSELETQEITLKRGMKIHISEAAGWRETKEGGRGRRTHDPSAKWAGKTHMLVYIGEGEFIDVFENKGPEFGGVYPNKYRNMFMVLRVYDPLDKFKD